MSSDSTTAHFAASSTKISLILSALGAGTLFGTGLALAGMTDPAVVLGFLDFAGAWNPALIFVMGGAVVVSFVGFRLILRQDRPRFAPAFSLPTRALIDGKLILGASLFGIGWGLSGYCPGPALASISNAGLPLVIFLCAMVIGMLSARYLTLADMKGR